MNLQEVFDAALLASISAVFIVLKQRKNAKNSSDRYGLKII
jgi:hypothetical protein